MNEDLIPEIHELFPSVEGFWSHFVERQHRLNLAAVTGSQGREAQLSGIARENHSPDDPRDISGCRVRF